MIQYNSMETAPKDGTLILVWDKYGGVDCEGCWQIVSWMGNHGYGKGKPIMSWCIQGTWGDEQGWYDNVYEPACWLPLPENPNIK